MGVTKLLSTSTSFNEVDFLRQQQQRRRETSKSTVVEVESIVDEWPHPSDAPGLREGLIKRWAGLSQARDSLNRIKDGLNLNENALTTKCGLAYHGSQRLKKGDDDDDNDLNDDDDYNDEPYDQVRVGVKKLNGGQGANWHLGDDNGDNWHLTNEEEIERRFVISTDRAKRIQSVRYIKWILFFFS